MAGIVVRLAGRLNANNPVLQKVVLPSVQQVCNISGKTMRSVQRPVKPAPYPYTEKNYSFFNALFDKTTKRFDENSKVIVVEGPIAAGKSQFCKELATELEMHFIPEPTLDKIYINPYGYDLRQLDPRLPKNCRSFDVKNFLADPHHLNVAQFQIRMYMLRYEAYIDALAHVLSTGQGVVLERSCYSDFVFLETMVKHGYISKGARSVYYDLKQNTIRELMKPHLVIYLDVPVKIVQERIQKRNEAHEVKSKVLTEAYLTDIETIYKQQYLKDISTHAELLVYDWSDFGETEVVVEDIERIQFDRFEKHDPKMKDWRLAPLEWNWCEARMKYTYEKPTLMSQFNVPRFDVPELVMPADESKILHEVLLDAPGSKFKTGYNADMGDTGILTKTKTKHNDFF